MSLVECTSQRPRSDYRDGCIHGEQSAGIFALEVCGHRRNHISYLELLAAMFAVKV